MSIYKEVKTTPLNKRHIAHKKWTVTDEDQSKYGIIFYEGQCSRGSFSISDVNDANIAIEPTTSNDYYRRIIFDNIHHLYYTDPESSFKSYDNQYFKQQTRNLNQRFISLSIPGNIFGDRIRENSFTMSNAAYAYLYDDGTGDIIDKNITDIAGFKKIDQDDYHISVDFNDGWKFLKTNPSSSIEYKSGDIRLLDISNGPYEPVGKNISFNEYSDSEENGKANVTFVNFHGSQSIQSESNSFVTIERSRELGQTSAWNKSYTISFWFNAPESQSVTSSFTGQFNTQDPLTIGTQYNRSLKDHSYNVLATSRQWSGNIPWEFQIYNSSTTDKGKIRFLRGISENTLSIKSADTYNDGNWHHVVLRYDSSNVGTKIALFIDGTKEGTDSSDPIKNEKAFDKSADITLGARPWGNKSKTFTGEVSEEYALSSGRTGFRTNKQFNKRVKNHIYPYSGSMDKFAIVDRALTDSEISSLYNNYRDTDVVGNIFYNHGMVVITDTSGSYSNLKDDFTLNFKGTTEHTIHNYQCIVEDEQYNVTYNPSARVNQDISEGRLQGFATSSDFAPYITTIGLYNDFNELLAIGKLANPVKSPQDIDIVFNVQFDT